MIPEKYVHTTNVDITKLRMEAFITVESPADVGYQGSLDHSIQRLKLVQMYMCSHPRSTIFCSQSNWLGGTPK